MPNTCISLVWFLSFFSYTKTTFLLQKNNESTLLHFDQFFAVFENGSTDWSWICWKYIACGFGIDWGLISAKRCQIDWLSRWIAAANDSHRAEEIKESVFFLTSRRIAKCLIYEPLIEKSIFQLFTGLVLEKNYITCQAGLSPIKPFHNLRTLLSQNRNKKRTNLLNPESNRFSLKCKFAINDYSVNTSLFFGGKFEVKFEILSCWQRSNRHPILHYHHVAVQIFLGCAQKSQWH